MTPGVTDKSWLAAVTMVFAIVGVCVIIVISLLLSPRGGVIFERTQPPRQSPGRGDGVAPSSDSPRPSVIYNVSAYCPCELCCGAFADGVTASGHVIQPGDKFVAADKSIPFGTMLDVPGYGLVPVLDRGGAIKGNKLDLYFDTHAEALQWGRKQLQVQRNM